MTRKKDAEKNGSGGGGSGQKRQGQRVGDFSQDDLMDAASEIAKLSESFQKLAESLKANGMESVRVDGYGMVDQILDLGDRVTANTEVAIMAAGADRARAEKARRREAARAKRKAKRARDGE